MKKIFKNYELVAMQQSLKPLLQLRDKLGFIAARNTRTIENALTEYEDFKNDLIKKYGEPDYDKDGNKLTTISIKVSSPNFTDFCNELESLNNIEQEVDLMTTTYTDAIGVLSGEEMLSVDWMLED
jgi:hypothetical protein